VKLCAHDVHVSDDAGASAVLVVERLQAASRTTNTERRIASIRQVYFTTRARASTSGSAEPQNALLYTFSSVRSEAYGAAATLCAKTIGR
jgi:hypothetical protein